MANIQIYQAPPKSSFSLTDLLATDDSTPSHVTWSVTGQQVVDLSSANVQINPSQVNGIAITQANTTNLLPQGTNNKYLTIDGGTTDNLIGMPNFDSLKTETDTHIADLLNPHQTTLQQAFNQNNVLVV